MLLYCHQGNIPRSLYFLHYMACAMAGVRKEEVKVQVEDGNILQISGEQIKEQEDKNDKWHPVERQCGNFVRRFQLPENANLDEIKCTLEHGVLTVTVPKKRPSRLLRMSDTLMWCSEL